MYKKALRQKMKERRLAIDAAHAAAYSHTICDRLSSLSCIKGAACIMAYAAIAGEPDLSQFIKASSDAGKCVALPRVGGKGEMSAARYHIGADMICNRYGIEEPHKGDNCTPDVVIVPGLVFDKTGHRIGFGGGYYDRFLAQTDAVKIGVCYDTQVIHHIKNDAHDVAMDIVMTEKRVYGDIKCV